MLVTFFLLICYSVHNIHPLLPSYLELYHLNYVVSEVTTAGKERKTMALPHFGPLITLALGLLTRTGQMTPT